MKICCLRHGRTNYNDLGLCNDDPGRSVHLTAEGVVQAQSAEIVNRFHNVPIETHVDLADIRSGFDSRPVSEYFAAITDDPLHKRVNGGESLLDHKQRVLRFIGWLKLQQLKSVLIVAHEETMRVFIAYFERNVQDEQLRTIHVDNCEFRYYVLTAD